MRSRSVQLPGSMTLTVAWSELSTKTGGGSAACDGSAAQTNKKAARRPVRQEVRRKGENSRRSLRILTIDLRRWLTRARISQALNLLRPQPAPLAGTQV